ncbi:MAG: hypothetical protein ACTSWD_12840 [Candidatus Heimdallarchaeota archaeon]
MKIKKLYLRNWQKHSELNLDFHDDINIISGYSNTGKSSIRRAIEWICFNANISECDYRKEGTSETSVKIELDNDFTIERIRSSKLNRYILSKADCEDKVFDSFGKNIPDEILDVLQIKTIEIDGEKLNLNIAEQLTLPFLLDKSASFRAKLFNKLTGNEVLDKVFKEFNKESLRVNRELKETEANIEKQEDELSEYSVKYKILKKKLKSVQAQYAKVEEDTEIYNHLKDLAEKLKTNKENQEFVDFKKSQIKTISEEKLNDLKAKAEVLEKLEKLSNSLEVTNCDIKSIKEKIDSIKVSKVDWDKLKAKDESLQNMKRLQEQSLQVNNDQEKVTIQIKEIKELVSNSEKELEQMWKDNPTCPLCGKENCNDN